MVERRKVNRKTFGLVDDRVRKVDTHGGSEVEWRMDGWEWSGNRRKTEAC